MVENRSFYNPKKLIKAILGIAVSLVLVGIVFVTVNIYVWLTGDYDYGGEYGVIVDDAKIIAADLMCENIDPADTKKTYKVSCEAEMEVEHSNSYIMLNNIETISSVVEPIDLSSGMIDELLKEGLDLCQGCEPSRLGFEVDVIILTEVLPLFRIDIQKDAQEQDLKVRSLKKGRFDMTISAKQMRIVRIDDQTRIYKYNFGSKI